MNTVIFTIEKSGESNTYDLEASTHTLVSELLKASAGLFGQPSDMLDIESWQMKMRSPHSPESIERISPTHTLAQAGVRDGYWLTLSRRLPVSPESTETMRASDAASSNAGGPVIGWRPLKTPEPAAGDANDDSDENQNFSWRKLG